ncbi:hypothetical protein DH2020_029151 [Rehmannia glutinosa]|uniref:Uncharacterized protein n=1 Tax=Rehmannia glutinosa TaxID=99300 RepID=A0ABR0VPF5_REHGL
MVQIVSLLVTMHTCGCKLRLKCPMRDGAQARLKFGTAFTSKASNATTCDIRGHFSAGAASFISALIVNPLDVAKFLLCIMIYSGCKHRQLEFLMMVYVAWVAFETSTVLQVVKYVPSSVCSPVAISQYVLLIVPSRGTLDRDSQDCGEGNKCQFSIGSPFCIQTHIQGGKPPGVENFGLALSRQSRELIFIKLFKATAFLWTGLGAQLARDVPFSAVCWSSLEPLRRRILSRIEMKPVFPVFLVQTLCWFCGREALAAAGMSSRCCKELGRR